MLEKFTKIYFETAIKSASTEAPPHEKARGKENLRILECESETKMFTKENSKSSGKFETWEFSWFFYMWRAPQILPQINWRVVSIYVSISLPFSTRFYSRYSLFILSSAVFTVFQRENGKCCRFRSNKHKFSSPILHGAPFYECAFTIIFNATFIRVLENFAHYIIDMRFHSNGNGLLKFLHFVCGWKFFSSFRNEINYRWKLL